MKEDIFLVECKKLVQSLFEILEIELKELTEQEKEILIAYSFGMISVMAEENQILLSIQYSAIEKVIMEVFQYSKQKTINTIKNIVDSTEKGGSEVFRIMVYQGKYVYPKYKDSNYNEVYDRLTNLIDVIVTGEYKN
ncbi:Imm48 family immunity protein [Wukongibacter baidiensis]|uniref:Imm48 family immunity protein n=1 Tax=Wukongibacter baidiensis TaxID=1723361 RepID=UPI003D80019E